MKKLLLLFGFLFVAILSQGQEVAEYDDYYIYNSLIFSEKSTQIPLVNGVLFYYDNGVDSTGLYFYDSERFYGLTPDDSLDYYVSRLELVDSLNKYVLKEDLTDSLSNYVKRTELVDSLLNYVSRVELVDSLNRYADTLWVQNQIHDSLSVFTSSPWNNIVGGIQYDNNVSVGDTLKTKSFNINHYSDGLNDVDRTSVYVLDSIRAVENITTGTDLTAFHMNTVIDSTAFTATGLNLRPIRNDYTNLQSGTQWVEGIGNYGAIKNSIDDFVYGFRNMVTIDAINEVDSMWFDDVFGINNQVINRQRLKITKMDDLHGFYNKLNVSSGLAGGKTYIENIYGVRTIIDEDADIIMNLSGNAYGYYLTGSLNVPNMYGFYEDNFAPNYFGSFTEIDDSLTVSDTARFIKPIYIDGNLFDGTGGGAFVAENDTAKTPNNVQLDSTLIVKNTYYSDNGVFEMTTNNDNAEDTLMLDFEKYNNYFVKRYDELYIDLDITKIKYGSYVITVYNLCTVGDEVNWKYGYFQTSDGLKPISLNSGYYVYYLTVFNRDGVKKIIVSSVPNVINFTN